MAGAIASPATLSDQAAWRRALGYVEGKPFKKAGNIMGGEGDHPEKLLARPVTAGAGALPYVLEADTLTELRGKLPSGLTRSERRPPDAPGVVEIWF